MNGGDFKCTGTLTGIVILLLTLLVCGYGLSRAFLSAGALTERPAEGGCTQVRYSAHIRIRLTKDFCFCCHR